MTGIGAVSTWGWGADELWRGLSSGTTGIAGARQFDTRGHRTRIAGEVPAAAPELARGYRDWSRWSRADRFAVAAAAEAWRAAGWTHPTEADPALPNPGLGVFFGGSTAGMAECEAELRAAHLDGHPDGHLEGHVIGERPAAWSPLASHQLNCPGDAVARTFGACGPVQSISSACASGALAIGAAIDALRAGDVEMALAGGSDSLCQLTYAGFNSLRAVDADPCRPFRDDRAGMSLGEGAGILVLETLEGALARGAEPLAELLGSGASCDAHHMTAPHPRGQGAAAAMRATLRDAGLTADAVDFINAHGTGTPLNDEAEGHALAEVFGARCLPVTSTKASVGHLLGSSGAIEAVATVQCLRAGCIHPVPTIAESTQDDIDVDLVLGRARPLASGSGRERWVALSTSFGFGGANAALALAGPGLARSVSSGAPTGATGDEES